MIPPGACSRKKRPSRNRIGRSFVAANCFRMSLAVPIGTGAPRPMIRVTRMYGTTAAASSVTPSATAAAKPTRRIWRRWRRALVIDREVELPLIARLPHAALPPALDPVPVSRDLADEALVEAGTVRAVPILAGRSPDLQRGAFEGHQEEPLDPARIEVVHRLRLAVGRAADDRDTGGHLGGLARRAEDDELTKALDLRLHGELHRGLHRDLSLAVPLADQRLELLHS